MSEQKVSNADVAEAQRLEAEYQSMHNGKMRDDLGESWYGSAGFRQHETAVLCDMGETMSAVLAYVAEREADIVRLQGENERLTNALKETEHQRDVAYSEFEIVYRSLDKFATMLVEAEFVPQSVLDEFRRDAARYQPLFEAAYEALHPIPTDQK